MKLWGRGQPAKSKGQFEPLLLQDDNRTLVFGADWAPLIGAKTDSAARRNAAALKATHYVVITASGQAGLGTTRLSRSDVKRIGKRRIFPAAAAFAAFRPTGTAVGFFELDDGSIWLVQSQNGLVRRQGDLVYKDRDMAWQRLYQLQADSHATDYQGGSWTFFGNIDDAQLEHLSLDELLNVEIRPFLPRRFSFDQLPKPVRVCFWLVLMFLASQMAIERYQSYARKQRLAELRANMQEPDRVWQRLIEEESARKRVDHAPVVERVYEELADMPLDIAGWRLHKTTCLPAGARWACSAQYHREAYGTTNEMFNQGVPKGWAASFDPLGTATGAWTFEARGASTGIAPEKLPSKEKVLLGPVSHLQSILPAFSSIRMATAEPWTLSTPLDGNGKPVSRPPTLLVPGVITLTLEGPLRSLSVWDVDATPTVIQKIVIDRVDAEASLKSSPLKMNLTGDMYVQSTK